MDVRETFTMKHAVFFKEIDSTNRLARELAAEGAPEGTVVYAARQTAGRGRLGKSFYSPVGGLYLSVVLRPFLKNEDMLALTAGAAVAVHRALLDFGIRTQMKWVNDLFLGGRKICGILCEGRFSGSVPEFIIAGIGVNLRPDPGLPAELRNIVTDIFTETGLSIGEEELGERILFHLQQVLRELPEREFLPEYSRNSCTIGHRVMVVRNGKNCEGLAVGYAPDAGLIVRLENGSETVIRSGSATVLDGAS